MSDEPGKPDRRRDGDEEQRPPQILKGSIEHLKRPVPTQTPVMLNYGSGKYDRPNPGGGSGQVMLGFLFWVLSVVAVVTCFGTFSARLGESGGYAIIATAISSVICVCIWVRVKLGWRSFLPGVLLGFGLTCLVPIGIVAAFCGFSSKL